MKIEESAAVGWKGKDGDGPGESVGHASVRHIIAIKRDRRLAGTRHGTTVPGRQNHEIRAAGFRGRKSYSLNHDDRSNVVDAL